MQLIRFLHERRIVGGRPVELGCWLQNRQSTGDADDTIIGTITQPIQVHNNASDKPSLHEWFALFGQMFREYLSA